MGNCSRSGFVLHHVVKLLRRAVPDVSVRGVLQPERDQVDPEAGRAAAAAAPQPLPAGWEAQAAEPAEPEAQAAHAAHAVQPAVRRPACPSFCSPSAPGCADELSLAGILLGWFQQPP